MSAPTVPTPGQPLWTVTGEEGLHPTDLPNCCRRASEGKLDPFDCSSCGARWYPLLTCSHDRCVTTFCDEGYDVPGYCGGERDGVEDGCGKPFCDDHLHTGDAFWDDGSGQYVEELPAPMCEACMDADRLPVEVYE